ncbi:hypothetical protein JTB14_019423 [Gonioctena quinquepunctata]|nr:hypothetical protein JTB14_019423 [Gonioctena quinquepunctata]
MEHNNKFKCCKKEFVNLFCTICYGIFHPSCLDRKCKYKELGGYKIFCSQNCEQKDIDKKKAADNLGKEVNKLRKSITERDEAINQLEEDRDEIITNCKLRIEELEKKLKKRFCL